MHNINGTINHDTIDLLDYISGFQLSSSNILPVSPGFGFQRQKLNCTDFPQCTYFSDNTHKSQEIHLHRNSSSITSCLGLTTLETTRIEHLNAHLHYDGSLRYRKAHLSIDFHEHDCDSACRSPKKTRESVTSRSALMLSSLVSKTGLKAMFKPM